VVFEDGFEYDVFEDELMESKEEFERPDAPKKNQQESIRRILREPVNESTFFRRRVDMSTIDKKFLTNLNIVTDKYLRKHNGYCSFNVFRTTVISYLIDDYRDNLSDEDYDNFPYDEVYDFLLKHFYDKIKDRYVEAFGGDINESIRKVLKEESIQDSLFDMINTDGFKKAAKAVGGGKRLMKILNLDGENLDEFIYQYLTENLSPEYDWGPENKSEKQRFKRNLKSYGIQNFNIDYDKDAYSYFGEWDGYDYLYLLSINRWVVNELTSLFGDKWIPVFKRWFEYNSGLEVREVDIEGRFFHEN
jgi:hypothetical protein